MILDSNVVSELFRPLPDPRVVEWFARRPSSRAYVTAVTRAELLVGIRRLPAGRRRQRLEVVAEEILDGGFFGGCLPFDLHAADVYASIKSAAEREGRALDIPDAQIASIALVSDLPLATRNVKDFKGIAGLELLNPWLDD